MTLQECYNTLDGNYQDVINRLHSERLVQKFVLKFLDDGNFALLAGAMDSGDQETAFRAAHTIKGMCQNLSFTRLADSSSQLTEALRAGNMAQAQALIGGVREDYERTAQAIRSFQAELV